MAGRFLEALNFFGTEGMARTLDKLLFAPVKLETFPPGDTGESPFLALACDKTGALIAGITPGGDLFLAGEAWSPAVARDLYNCGQKNPEDRRFIITTQAVVRTVAYKGLANLTRISHRELPISATKDFWQTWWRSDLVV